MISPFEGQHPQLGRDVYVAPDATIIGRVQLGDESSIWCGTVLRGDVGGISVGRRTNIQDLCVVHVTTDEFDTVVGDDVTVGHRVILHGCTIEDHVLVGMGAIVMDGARVGSYSIVGAGALVTPGTQIPPGSLALGAPARAVRPLTDAERRQIDGSVSHYVELAQRYSRSG